MHMLCVWNEHKQFLLVVRCRLTGDHADGLKILVAVSDSDQD